MFLGILVLITALSISAVAIYYSVAGIVAIFAAAAVPIMIMGSVLEIGKLVTAVWLHRYWQQAKWWLKTYLTLAVVILMFITSMGIFGFLSKAHIEQTASAQEGIAQIEQIEAEIQRQTVIVERARTEIANIQGAGVSQDNTVQEQIDREQQRIETAYSRIQPAVDEQLAVISREESQIADRIAVFDNQLDQLTQRLLDLDAALNANDVSRAQGIVGVKQDGALGTNTSAAIQNFRLNEEARRKELLETIDQIRTAPNSTVQSARDEISRLRNLAEQQIQDSNTLINRLRDQLGTVDAQAVDQQINEQEIAIAQASGTIDTLTEQKYSLQTEYRKLEAEVGPVKYLAEFIYGEAADQNMLEEAVRWVIIIIIFVFDPLAVLLLIASQTTFELRHKERVQQNQAKQEIISDNTSNNIEHVEHAQPDAKHHSVDSSGNNRTDQENETIDILAYAEWIGADDNARSLDRSRREQRLDDLENDEEIKTAKAAWKADNPNLTIKTQKELYIQGKIDELPWEGYVQNSEQTTSSIWNKIKANDNN
jgi:hypothetical protein